MNETKTRRNSFNLTEVHLLIDSLKTPRSYEPMIAFLTAFLSHPLALIVWPNSSNSSVELTYQRNLLL